MLGRLLVIILLACSFSILAGSGNSDGKSTNEKPFIVSSNPPNGATGVNRNIQEIEIHFNKEMGQGRSVSASVFWPLSNRTLTKWSTDHKTLWVSRNNGSNLLPAGTVIHITFNPLGHPLNLKDTFGNSLDTYNLSFTTGQ